MKIKPLILTLNKSCHTIRRMRIATVGSKNQYHVLTSEDVDAMQEENRHLKDMLANLSKTHATDMQRLSDMIDKRQEALRYISEIIEEKAAEREDLELGSTAYKSVRRWASKFLHNDERMDG
jgi:predicted DNA-binding protein